MSRSTNAFTEASKLNHNSNMTYMLRVTKETNKYKLHYGAAVDVILPTLI